jgi:two-component SAPR family response regulator
MFNRNAFNLDYLLNPVDKADLEKVLLKYNKLHVNFSHTTTNAPIENLVKFINQRKNQDYL